MERIKIFGDQMVIARSFAADVIEGKLDMRGIPFHSLMVAAAQVEHIPGEKFAAPICLYGNELASVPNVSGSHIVTPFTIFSDCLGNCYFSPVIIGVSGNLMEVIRK